MCYLYLKLRVNCWSIWPFKVEGKFLVYMANKGGGAILTKSTIGIVRNNNKQKDKHMHVQ